MGRALRKCTCLSLLALGITAYYHLTSLALSCKQWYHAPPLLVGFPCLCDCKATSASGLPILPHFPATYFFGTRCRHLRTYVPAVLPKTSTSHDADGLARNSELKPAQFVPT